MSAMDRKPFGFASAQQRHSLRRGRHCEVRWEAGSRGAAPDRVAEGHGHTWLARLHPHLADTLSAWERWAPTAAYIELIGPSPTDAKAAAFSFGRCRGCLEGIFGATGIPVTMLTVPTWRRAVGLSAGATKEMARGEAIRRWPSRAEMIARVRDNGPAEVCLIGVAGLLGGTS
jgi:hypothetical protein